MLRQLFVLALLGLVATVPAQAQNRGPHGGLVAGKGHHQTELLVTPTELTVYVLDDGKAHSAEGMTVRAVVQDSGKTSTITFAKDGKRLVGKLPAPLAKGAIVVLTGKDDHGDPLNARYVIE